MGRGNREGERRKGKEKQRNKTLVNRAGKKDCREGRKMGEKESRYITCRNKLPIIMCT